MYSKKNASKKDSNTIKRRFITWKTIQRNSFTYTLITILTRLNFAWKSSSMFNYDALKARDLRFDVFHTPSDSTPRLSKISKLSDSSYDLQRFKTSTKSITNQNQIIQFDISNSFIRYYQNDLKNSNEKIFNIKKIEISIKRKRKRVVKKYIIKSNINNEMLLIKKKTNNVFVSIYIIKNFILNITNFLNV